LVLSIVSLFSGSFGLAIPASAENNQIKVMTWNLYLGGDVTPVLLADSETEFFIRAATLFNNVQTTNFPARAESIADEIATNDPDIIGLQEVVLWRTQIPSNPTTPATDVALDFLDILLFELAQRGLNYVPVAVQIGTDIETPALFPTGLIDVRLTDRDVILAKSELQSSISNVQGAKFVTVLTLNTIVGPIDIPRSWVSIDLELNPQTVRIVSTHLEPVFPDFQEAQANELILGPGNTALPVIFVGDFNSNADGSGTVTYGNLIAAGLTDSWNEVINGMGDTCCQDSDLLNPTSELDRRIDLVLHRGGFVVNQIDIVGEVPEDRTPSGLWPSDHAGIVAQLQLQSVAVGGKMIPVESISLILAGTQTIAAWMIPVIVSGIGFAIVIARKF